MSIEVSSSLKRKCFVLWLTLSFVLLSNTVCTPFMGLRVRASSDPVDADLNGDGAVDVLDIVTAAIAFGSDPEHPRWDPEADLNNDDFVDILDMVLILSNSKFSNSETASNASSREDLFNGVWTWKTYINTDMLNNLVSHQIFNVFVSVGYPNPNFDSRLEGIVPEDEIGIVISPQEVASLKQLLASVDSRLKLWAWFGTWSLLATDDHSGHYYAKVDLSTSYNREVIIENIVEVASWGFYGVQDDTEDYTDNTTPQNRIDFWNEEQAALNQIGVKLATFTYSGPASLWWVKDYVSQLKVDYIILCADQRQSQEVIDVYGSIETIWKSEITTGLSVARSPCLINVPSAYGSGLPAQTLNVQLEWLSEIDPTSYPNYVGHTIYCYKDGIVSITNTEWAAWDNYLSTL